MEIAIPLVALSGLYFMNKQSKKSSIHSYENFANKADLPNTDIPNRNYPTEYPVVSSELDQTSSLSKNNRFDAANGVYTDKYFNPDVATLGTADPNGMSSAQSIQSRESYYSLTGKQVGADYFSHNNMVPFFGSNLRTRHADDNANESSLDAMNGSGSQLFQKREQSPMFSPNESLQWAYGTPNNTDFIRSRINPVNKMANVKPFAEERVAPGLGLGYTTEGSGGFNSGMAMRDSWLDRGVDELRVANKPKSSGHMLLGHEGPAIHAITMRGELGHQEKYRPETAFEMNQDRYFTTVGSVTAPTLRSIPIDRDVTRPETTTSYSGIANSKNPASYVPGEYMPSTNIQLGEVPIGVADAIGRGYANDGDYGMKAKHAYPNNRTENKQGDYFGIVGGAIGAAVAPLLDALRPSRKENTIGTLRPYQNPGSSVPQSYIFNPADRLNTTIRETTEINNSTGYINKNQHGGAYAVTSATPILNNRTTTDDFSYIGIGSANERGRQMRSYDDAYRQRNNDNKSSTVAGYTPNGKMDLFSGDINMQGKAKESYLQQTRAVQPAMPIQTPDIANFGSLQGQNTLYSNIQLDRTNPEILSSLKSNPYALSVTNAF